MGEKPKREPLRPWSPAHYRIDVQGAMAEGWADIFSGMQITTQTRADRTVITSLSGLVMDQSELAGVLNSLLEIHLPILLVEHIAEK